MKKATLALAALGFLGWGNVAAQADGVVSWTPDQFRSKRPVYYWQNGNLERFVHTTEKADWDRGEYSYEAAKYWTREAERSRHHTVSYYVDVGDLHYRMGSKRDALTYYQLAHTLRRKTVEDNIELGEAYSYVQEPGLADYYFTEAMRFARSRKDWALISDGYSRIGNKHMAEIAGRRAAALR